MTGKIVSINISKKVGTKKTPVKTVILKKNAGILTDAHFSSKRPVSLLSWDDVKEWKNKSKQEVKLKYGIFAENISFEGFSLKKVKLNKIIFINKKVKLKIIQVGKKCHSDCEIKKTTGSCIMPKYGVFAKVLSGGKISVGDIIEML
jgi:MOSC domain-containing protein YiiM